MKELDVGGEVGVTGLSRKVVKRAFEKVVRGLVKGTEFEVGGEVGC